MKTLPNYLNLVRLIYHGTLPLEGFLEMLEIDLQEVQTELEFKAIYVGNVYAKNSVERSPMKMYFFDYQMCPSAVELLHAVKLFAFAKSGSPYKHQEIPAYDKRQKNPYIQAIAYRDGKIIAGMRLLQLYKGISYKESSMHELFTLTDEFKKKFLPHALEVGQTFVDPSYQQSIEGQHALFSIFAAIIARNPEAKYLMGRPTISGVIHDVGKNIISSLMYDVFGPVTKLDLNPEGKDMITYPHPKDIVKIKRFTYWVKQYNEDIKGTGLPRMEYNVNLPSRKKVKMCEDILGYYLISMPPVITFYSKVTQDGNGFFVLGKPVKNKHYTTKSPEFVMIVVINQISTTHLIYLDHVKQFLQ